MGKCGNIFWEQFRFLHCLNRQAGLSHNPKRCPWESCCSGPSGPQKRNLHPQSCSAPTRFFAANTLDHIESLNIVWLIIYTEATSHIRGLYFTDVSTRIYFKTFTSPATMSSALGIVPDFLETPKTVDLEQFQKITFFRKQHW